MKQITITVPDNCELKQYGNTYTIVEKGKKLTYDDIAKELFHSKSGYYITTTGKINYNDSFGLSSYMDANNCTSRRQAEKLLAINKLMNLAKWLNDGWKPDWDYRHEDKYYIYVEDEQIKVLFAVRAQWNNVYFKSEELAQQAIEILGEETIKLALCTDY